jgi:CheY-like chemotaxis protein
MLLQSPKLIPADRPIELGVKLPGGEQELRITAQARFVGPTDDGFAVGVQILQMSETDTLRWRSYCQPQSGSLAFGDAETAQLEGIRDNANILLVSSVVPASMLQRLVQSGHRLTVAQDQMTALSLLRQRRDFEILIAELRRRDLDGTTLCNLVKQDRALRHTHIILVADSGEAQDLVGGLDAGATYVVSRPFTDAFLLSLITLCQRG